MTDKAIENAKALKIQAISEIERLEGELRYWRDRMAMSEHFIDQWNAFASGDPVNSGDSVSSDVNKTATSPKPNQKAKRNSKKEDVADAALQFIRERGRPSPRTELYEALVDRGFTIEGADPEMVLSTMLWRMKDKIVRIPNYGYWPIDEVYAPADYHPDIPYQGDEEHAEMARQDTSGIQDAKSKDDSNNLFE